MPSRSWPALREEFPALRLDLVGSGWWHDQLVGHARSLGVEDLVVWHGHVSDVERDRVLARAWVALLPSTNEGWGLSVVEAAAQATPTVAYRAAGGVNESILHGRHGLLVSGQDERGGSSAAAARATPSGSRRWLQQPNGTRGRSPGRAQPSHWKRC